MLHELFAAQVAREGKQQHRAVDALFLWAWGDGADDGLWNFVWSTPDKKVSKLTPLSSYLSGLFSEWGKSFTSLTPDLEFLYERFELLGSVAHLEATEQSDLEKAMADNRPNSWVWAPVGRYAWHTSNFERLLQEIGEEPFRRELLDAGFARGNETFLGLAVENIKRIARRVR